MPLIRPDAISDRIRLSDKFRTEMAALVAEGSAVDAHLSLAGSGVDAVIEEAAPDEEGVTVEGPQDKFLSWPDEQQSLSSVAVVADRVVAFVHREAVTVTVLR